MNYNSKYIKKTKIVSTLGPSTNDKKTLKEMMERGVDVFRINFSHADYKDVAEKVKIIRSLNEQYGFNTAILADLQGPKLRIGEVKEGVEIHPGDVLTFTNKKVKGDGKQVYMNYERFPLDVEVGEKILVDDGKIILKTLSTDKKSIVKAEVIQGGPLNSRKGVNLPNTNLSLPSITEKDIKDVEYAIELEVDWVALSFVRKGQDVAELRKIMEKLCDYKIPIIAKIEKPEALENIDDIIIKSDGLMVARGDLGVEMPLEEVPQYQKMLIRKAKEERIPVIVATQMMESMIDSLVPTRAEVNDVANAVYDGADAVMLSGETSVGNHPVEVIETMSKILQQVEDSSLIKVPTKKPKDKNKRFITKVVCYHAAKMASLAEAKAISLFTYSGYTAFQISSYRPLSYILVFTPNKRRVAALNLLWGVKAIYFDPGNQSTDETVIQVNRIAVMRGYVNWGDYVVNLNTMPVFRKGGTNTLRLTTI